ncbi:hypothetical protein scyTo_0017409 [Scyliorhinus torazame]|uniref:Leukotriene C4 synthase n=1 Tax=Scyliorhinus torazame TaxID=75743 RepID=A0A401PS79_SCYTO|nr:hypothetical protein [Scyliorhinus torazame]
MLEEFAPLALVTILAALQQAYFALQVIHARRRFHIPPPAVSGNEDFERVYRAHRYKYFIGYSESALQRLRPLYFGATMLWILIGLASLGVLSQLCSRYLGYNPMTAARSYVEL